MEEIVKTEFWVGIRGELMREKERGRLMAMEALIPALEVGFGRRFLCRRRFGDWIPW